MADIGAPCRQCRGRRFYGGQAPYAHPGHAVREPCDICDGTGIEGGTYTPPSGLSQQERNWAAIQYADAHMATVEPWRFSLGRD